MLSGIHRTVTRVVLKLLVPLRISNQYRHRTVTRVVLKPFTIFFGKHFFVIEQ